MRLRAAAVAGLAVGLLAACSSSPPPAPPLEPAKVAPGDLAAGRDDTVADPVYPFVGNPGIDVLHYGLSLSWNPDSGVLRGHAVVTVRAIAAASTVSLDLAEPLTVSAVTADGESVTSAHPGNKLEIAHPVAADAAVVLAIDYEGEPHSVPAPATRQDMTEGVGVAVGTGGELWTFQEPYGAFTWYPVNDIPSDEALYDFTVTVPEGWTGVATGVVGEESTADGWHVTRFHSDDPVASYVTTLAVDRFERVDGGTTDGGAPVVSWVTGNRRAEWEPVLAAVPATIAWLEKRYGPYPFAYAGVVVTGGRSGMETQGTITLSDGLTRRGPAGLLAVLTHEFAHQWFGDAVTPTDWRGIWLNEGMATYVQAMWTQEQGGETLDAAVARWRADDQRLRDEAGTPGAFKPQAFASGNVYSSPAAMLHEIRTRMDEAAFEAMMRDWVQERRNSHQDRASFTAWVVSHGGEELRAVIDMWLDSATTPP